MQYVDASSTTRLAVAVIVVAIAAATLPVWLLATRDENAAFIDWGVLRGLFVLWPAAMTLAGGFASRFAAGGRGALAVGAGVALGLALESIAMVLLIDAPAHAASTDSWSVAVAFAIVFLIGGIPALFGYGVGRGLAAERAHRARREEPPRTEVYFGG